VDPDVALNRLLRLAGESEGEWADTLLGLDSWISKGGFLPQRWRNRGEEIEAPPGGFFVSTHCNCAHDTCTGDALEDDHEDCWIHPLALRVEETFGVDVLYRLTEGDGWFSALLQQDMDDLDIEEAWAEVKAKMVEQ
jgi:hypothetical protein